MHSSSSYPAGLIISALLALGACTAGDPNLGRLDSAASQDQAAPDAHGGCPSPPSFPAPVLDPFSAVTSSSRQALRGNAAGASRVTAVGGAASSTASVGQDGRFCIEVMLIPDSSNSFTLTALDKHGCPGKETKASILHKSVAGADGGVTSETNLSKKQPVFSKDAPKTGTLQDINDGNINTGASFSFMDWDWKSTCDAYTWVKIDLGKPYTVSKVNIFWGPAAGNDYGTCYSVLISASDSPGDPDPAQQTIWQTAHAEVNGSASDQSISVGHKIARWVALLMYENGGTGLTETFKLAELEVIGQDPSTNPQPADRCN